MDAWSVSRLRVMDEQSRQRCWTYDALLPYFRNTEICHNPRYDPHQHGYKGPISTISVSANDKGRQYPLRDTIRQAWTELGLGFVSDANTGNPLGVSELVESWRDGKRQLPSNAYDMSMVSIIADTLVSKILIRDISGSKTATGVVLSDGRILSARREAIISSGAYRTPQMLILPGIGPSATLEKHGIPLHVHLPDVRGQHQIGKAEDRSRGRTRPRCPYISDVATTKTVVPQGLWPWKVVASSNKAAQALVVTSAVFANKILVPKRTKCWFGISATALAFGALFDRWP